MNQSGASAPLFRFFFGKGGGRNPTGPEGVYKGQSSTGETAGEIEESGFQTVERALDGRKGSQRFAKSDFEGRYLRKSGLLRQTLPEKAL